MATKVTERCGQIFGKPEGSDFFMAVAQSGKNEAGETLYHYGAYFTLPDSIKNLADSDVKKYATIGAKRLISVSQAPFRGQIEKGELSAQDVEDWFNGYNGNGLDVKLNEVPERKAPVPTGVTPLVQASRDVLELGLMRKGGFDPATISKADLKTIRTQVREHQKANDQKWQWALAKGEKELANRMKKADDMPE